MKRIPISQQDFVHDIERARRWSALRQDSGDPLSYAPRAREIYESMGIDFREKLIIYSDALTLDKALKIKAQCDEIGFPCEHINPLEPLQHFA